jgi:hypothetical protein
MIQAHNLSTGTSGTAANAPKPGEATIFSIPIGRLGLFSSLLMGGAAGSIAFLITFFLAIVGVTIYDSATGTSMLNLNISYRYIAAPVGILVMVVSITYLVTLWVRRKFAGRE